MRDCNAAMRDGRWKLVRPAIADAMQVAAADLMADIDMKNRPEAYETVTTDPEPLRHIGALPAAQLFDIDADPGEAHDLAAAEPGRVARMETELGRWFESVEADRLTAAL